MANRKVYHVTAKDSGGWQVKAEGAKGVSGSFEKKPDAIARAKALAQKQKLGGVVVHKKDGGVQNKILFGEPPKLVKAKKAPKAKKTAKKKTTAKRGKRK